MTRDSSNITSMPIKSIGIGEAPSDLVEDDSSSFSRFFSDSAVCRECFELFSMDFVFDSRCPHCGSYVDDSNIVVSMKGPEASLKRAIELSRKLKEQNKPHIVSSRDIDGDEA